MLRFGARLVGLGRVELPTSPLSGARSSQLSYRPSCPGSESPGVARPPRAPAAGQEGHEPRPALGVLSKPNSACLLRKIDLEWLPLRREEDIS